MNRGHANTYEAFFSLSHQITNMFNALADNKMALPLLDQTSHAFKHPSKKPIMEYSRNGRINKPKYTASRGHKHSLHKFHKP